MPLSDVVEHVPALVELPAKRRRFSREAGAPGRGDMRVEHNTMVVRIEAGKDGRSRRRADRRSCKGVVEDYGLRRKTVQIRCPADRISIAAKSVASKLIDEENDDVGRLRDHAVAT